MLHPLSQIYWYNSVVMCERFMETKRMLSHTFAVSFAASASFKSIFICLRSMLLSYTGNSGSSQNLVMAIPYATKATELA